MGRKSRLKKLRRESKLNNQQDINPEQLPVWQDSEGLHSIMPGEPPSEEKLAEMTAAHPTLTANMLLLFAAEGINLADTDFSIGAALDKVPAETLRQRLLSLDIAWELNKECVILRQALSPHCLAVAACAKDIAEITSPQINPQAAYLAGLLHDIGKIALSEAMPKSLVRINEQAESQNLSAATTEQKNLGIDHTILGKRLVQKWRLPDEIVTAVWLHHTDVDAVSQTLPEAGIARILRAADSLVRNCNIGRSGSFDLPDSTEQIAQSLGIAADQLEQIGQNAAIFIPIAADQRGEYCQVAHNAAVQLLQENAKLSDKNRLLQTESRHFDFIAEVLSTVDSTTSSIETAKALAHCWQKFYQTGKVCIYLTPSAGSQLVEAVIVESPTQSRAVCLEGPPDCDPIPDKDLLVSDVDEQTNWLFEKLDVDFELTNTKMTPLFSGGRAIGAIVFEFHQPADPEQLQQIFNVAASIAGTVLSMTLAHGKQQDLAERFAAATARPQIHAPAQTPPEKTQDKTDADNITTALAEMAAGAAHELNNPLSVISGRAQLLSQSETDETKKQALQQIRQNADELTQIIDGLMSFAQPQTPRQAETDVRQMLDEAVQFAALKTKNDQLDAEIEIPEQLNNVFVDSAQIVSAIANCLCNSLESYTEGTGPIKITAAQTGDVVALSIVDFGCGMDAQTVRKAAQPFFSNKPAGRKRGMGLAYATRLIELNGGSFNIQSQPGDGTTVTIQLPCQ